MAIKAENHINRKIFKIILVIIILIVAFIIVATEGKGAYKLSGSLHISKTIDESIDRGVFIDTLFYVTIPDSIRLSINKYNSSDTTLLEKGIFFIEKGYRLGEWTARVTDSLKKEDSFKFQIGLNNYLHNGNRFRMNNYIIKGNTRLIKISDTIYFEVYKLKEKPSDTVNKAGKLLLFKKNDNKSNIPDKNF